MSTNFIKYLTKIWVLMIKRKRFNTRTIIYFRKMFLKPFFNFIILNKIKIKLLGHGIEMIVKTFDFVISS